MRKLRGEEKFSIIGVLAVMFLFSWLILGIKSELNYSPINLDESSDLSSGVSEWFNMKSLFTFLLIGFIIILLIIVLIKLIYKRKEKEVDKINDSSLNNAGIFVSQMRKRGYNDLTIRNMFLDKGWSEGRINLIMR